MLKIKGLYLPMLADRIITGDVYWLNSAETNTNDMPSNGKDPTKPFATLDYALSKMTAGQGDYLIAGPGHAETLTAAGSIDVAGIHIMGCQCGGLTPTFTGNGTIDCISIDADDVEFNGFRFGAPGTDAQTAAINIDADSAVVKNIYVPECSVTSGSVNIVDVISLTANADNCLIENVQIWNSLVAVTSFLHFEGAASNVTVKNFFAFGDVATAGVRDSAKVGYLYMRNVDVAVVGTTMPACALDSNPEGVAIDCRFLSTSATIAAGCSLGNLMRSSNVLTSNETDGSLSAFIYPAIDAAT